MKEYNLVDSERELEHFFVRERLKNISLIRSRYSLSTEDAEDVYQESAMALFKKIKEGGLAELTVSLSTYFTRICINQSLNKRRDSHKNVSIDNFQHGYDFDRVEELIDEAFGEDKESKYEEIREIVKDLPSPCETILWSFYEDKLSLSDIAAILHYKNADTAKSKKSQCMSKLKQRFDKKGGSL